jgi:uncharacterized membrane protein SpoIIM required for sporulation
VARFRGGIEELAVSTAARRFTSPFVLWSAGAFGVFMLGAWVGALGAWLTPGAQLDPTNSIGSALEIFLHNLVVLGLISAGGATLGMTTLGALFLNGGLVGYVGTELLERHQFGMFMTAVAPQLALELGAYVLAAGATLRLGWSIWWPLVSRRKGGRVRWRQWVVFETAAVFMLFGGAVVEAAFSHV